MYLSKSDFKVARTCPTKLYYRKLRFPSRHDDDPYLEFLADGGYMVETVAKLLFKGGREISFDSDEEAVQLTRHALKATNVTLFEATLVYGQLLARVDILEKRADRYRLIEVKAKGFDSEADGKNPFRGKQGGIMSKWRPYLEDATFQTYILRALYPKAQVTPFLCLVDKSKTCGTEASFDKFQIEPREKREGERVFSRPKVTFTGDIKALRAAPYVSLIDVSQEVEELMPEVTQAAGQYALTLTSTPPRRILPSLGVGCKKCEYRMEGVEDSGFRECWGELADVSPHLLDLYRVDALGPKGRVAADLIARGRCNLRDVSRKDLRGKVGQRQAVQIEWTQKSREYIDPQLAKILASCKYPLHFIDFEASRTAVPYHAGMHPYEQVTFQWSCHTIPARGAELRHAEWINIEQRYPNFEFAEALKNAIGDRGTVFIWSPFERTALRDIRRQLTQYGRENAALDAWLAHITSDNGPLVDLWQLAKEHYFHPRMAGSLSIKDVLPAVWFESPRVRDHPWFSQYLRKRSGKLIQPYEALDPLPFGDEAADEEADVVREGTAAIRTYQEMMYGLHKSDEPFREVHKKLLLNYCQLDTAAMVMIWMHWTQPR